MNVSSGVDSKLLFVESIIRCASEYGGRVFGGYVRDVIIPRLDDPSCDVSFRDVDIWFIDQNLSYQFIVNMTQNHDFKLMQVVPNAASNVEKVIYELKRPNNNIIFGIVNHHVFPVDDFDVNYLYYRHINDCKFIGEWDKGYGTQVNKDHHLVKSILKKEMIMSPKYYDKLSHNLNGDAHIARINERFIDRGWTIKYNGISVCKRITGNVNDIFSPQNEVLIDNNVLPTSSIVDELIKANQKVKDIDIQLKEALKIRDNMLCECIDEIKHDEAFIENIINFITNQKK